jgi:hypothetical protein
MQHMVWGDIPRGIRSDEAVDKLQCVQDHVRPSFLGPGLLQVLYVGGKVTIESTHPIQNQVYDFQRDHLRPQLVAMVNLNPVLVHVMEDGKVSAQASSNREDPLLPNGS